MKVRYLLCGGAMLCWLSLSAHAAFGQDALARAQGLYREANYEEALALLAGPAMDASADGQLYRALCLIALGRADEAETAISQSIAIDPSATRDRTDVSPRIATMLVTTRRRLLPEVARKEVADGRAARQGGDQAKAAAHFTNAVRLLEDPVLADQPDLKDLRLVAEGFLDLIQAQRRSLTSADTATGAARKPEPAVSPGPVAPAPSSVPQGTASTTTGDVPERAQPAPPTGPPPAKTATPVVTPAKAISQTLPAWRPDANMRAFDLRGSLRLNIDATGRVTDARMEESIAPAFDRLLIEAAREWRYQPATRDGVPTTSELVIPIVLPRRTP